MKKISGFIDKLNRSELEESIIKSLYWLGEAQKDRSDASSWVKLWSCLECFFTLGEDEITEKNARGISSLLIYGGYYHEQYRDYEVLKKKIKKFYGFRSKVVHHAEYTHIEEHLLLEFSYIVAWSIITMVSLIDRGYTQLSEIREKADMLESSSLSKQ